MRTFTLNYFLSDGTCAIREPPLRNSGHVGGSFSKRHRVEKPARMQTLVPKPVSASSAFEAAPVTAYYEASDLYVGATIEFVGKVFEVVKCRSRRLRLVSVREGVLRPFRGTRRHRVARR